MKTSARNYLDIVEGTYVEPGHDVKDPPVSFENPGGKWKGEYIEGRPDGALEPTFGVTKGFNTDVTPEQFGARPHLEQQIASLTDAVDRLQRRVEELERREPW